MGFDKDFTPIIRFTVVSDIHYEDEPTVERERFAKALETSYMLSRGEKYGRLDALYVVGDFATRGSEVQMLAFKKSIEDSIKPETEVTLSMASHEFSQQNGGESAALERFGRIFGMEPDTHKVINGFHFISITSTNGCHFDEKKKAYAARELAIAAADSPYKPIFFFQHPHITDTVYGSINWGEDELTPILMNYPQVIDFSGHSHAPINDPRSVHQRHFTCHGTGTLSYFELDEFDKIYGTVPPDDDIAAQMLIVEADANNRVRIYPYDLITGNFFPCVRRIDRPWDVSSFIYTDARLKSTVAPYFEAGTKITCEAADGGVKVTFGQAKISEDYVDDYNIIIKDSRGVTVRSAAIWSKYYLFDMPSQLSIDFTSLGSGSYTAEVYANSFWKTKCAEPLKAEFTIE